MCKGVAEWQYYVTATVRVTSGNLQNIALPKQYANVDAVRLDEYFVVGLPEIGRAHV